MFTRQLFNLFQMTSLKYEYLPKRCNLVYACFVGSNCQVISVINDGKLKYLFLEFENLSIDRFNTDNQIYI